MTVSVKNALLASIILACMTSKGQAHDDYSMIKADCDSLQLTIGSGVNTQLEIGAFWKNPAVFPNPPKSDSTKNYNKPYFIECPNLGLYDDGNMVEIKADSYQALLNSIATYDKDFNLYARSGYIYPNIREGFFFKGYSFNPETFNLESQGGILQEGMDFKEGFLRISVASDIPNTLVLAYQIDDGELKPMLYDMKVYEYKRDFEKANVINIYQKLDEPVVVERFTIDKANGSIRMYRKHPFPK